MESEYILESDSHLEGGVNTQEPSETKEREEILQKSPITLVSVI